MGGGSSTSQQQQQSQISSGKSKGGLSRVLARSFERNASFLEQEAAEQRSLLQSSATTGSSHQLVKVSAEQKQSFASSTSLDPALLHSLWIREKRTVVGLSERVERRPLVAPALGFLGALFFFTSTSTLQLRGRRCQKSPDGELKKGLDVGLCVKLFSSLSDFDVWREKHDSQQAAQQVLSLASGQEEGKIRIGSWPRIRSFTHQPVIGAIIILDEQSRKIKLISVLPSGFPGFQDGLLLISKDEEEQLAVGGQTSRLQVLKESLSKKANLFKAFSPKDLSCRGFVNRKFYGQKSLLSEERHDRRYLTTFLISSDRHFKTSLGETEMQNVASYQEWISECSNTTSDSSAPGLRVTDSSSGAATAWENEIPLLAKAKAHCERNCRKGERGGVHNSNLSSSSSFESIQEAFQQEILDFSKKQSMDWFAVNDIFSRVEESFERHGLLVSQRRDLDAANTTVSTTPTPTTTATTNPSIPPRMTTTAVEKQYVISEDPLAWGRAADELTHLLHRRSFES